MILDNLSLILMAIFLLNKTFNYSIMIRIRNLNNIKIILKKFMEYIWTV